MREREKDWREAASWGAAGWADEYGMVSAGGRLVSAPLHGLLRRRRAAAEEEEEGADEPEPALDAAAGGGGEGGGGGAAGGEGRATVRLQRDMAAVVAQQTDLMSELRSLRAELVKQRAEPPAIYGVADVLGEDDFAPAAPLPPLPARPAPPAGGRAPGGYGGGHNVGGHKGGGQLLGVAASYSKYGGGGGYGGGGRLGGGSAGSEGRREERRDRGEVNV